MDIKPVLAAIARHFVTAAAVALASHGVIQSSQTEAVVGAGMLLCSVGWSVWDQYGRSIVLDELAVLKANAAARAAKVSAPTPKL